MLRLMLRLLQLRGLGLRVCHQGFEEHKPGGPLVILSLTLIFQVESKRAECVSDCIARSLWMLRQVRVNAEGLVVVWQPDEAGYLSNHTNALLQSSHVKDACLQTYQRRAPAVRSPCARLAIVEKWGDARTTSKVAWQPISIFVHNLSFCTCVTSMCDVPNVSGVGVGLTTNTNFVHQSSSYAVFK